MQGSKELVQTESEDDIVVGLSEHIRESLVSEDQLIIWGSGDLEGDWREQRIRIDDSGH